MDQKASGGEELLKLLLVIRVLLSNMPCDWAVALAEKIRTSR
jgi:hypothetical protein